MAAPDAADVDAALASMLALDHPPTALITGNSRLPHAALRSWHGVLQSLAVVGFVDFELADVLDVPVTVVAQDAAGVGRRAAELLFERIRGDPRPRPSCCPSGSSNAARASGPAQHAQLPQLSQLPQLPSCLSYPRRPS